MAAARGRRREWDGGELGGPSPPPLSAPVVCLVRSAGDFAAGSFVGSLVGYALLECPLLVSPQTPAQSPLEIGMEQLPARPSAEGSSGVSSAN